MHVHRDLHTTRRFFVVVVTGKSVGAVLFQLVNIDISVTCGSVISEGGVFGETANA